MLLQLVLPANARPPDAVMSEPSSCYLRVRSLRALCCRRSCRLWPRGPSEATEGELPRIAKKPLATLPRAVPAAVTPSAGEPVPALLADAPLTPLPIAVPSVVVPSAVEPMLALLVALPLGAVQLARLDALFAATPSAQTPSAGERMLALIADAPHTALPAAMSSAAIPSRL